MEMEAIPKDLTLIVTEGVHEGERFSINKFPCAIGRKADNDIVLGNDRYASSRHCEIVGAAGKYWVRDLKSANGTYVNGKRIHKPTPLELRKSTLYIGRSQLLLDDGKQNMLDLDLSKTCALENVIAANSIIVPSMASFKSTGREESLLVVDICNSTELANRYGEDKYLRSVYTIAQSVKHNSELNDVLFLKCTGDGFFATFPDTRKALRVACKLLRDMERISGRVRDLLRPGLRLAVHRGMVNTDHDGERLGLACHLVFRLEGARIEDRAFEPANPVDLPKQNRILITDEAMISLGSGFYDCFTYAGDFVFKGFADPIRVNLCIGALDNLLGKLG